MANDGNWVPAPSDLEFLARQGANEREAVLAAGLLDGAPAWRIGEVAGYGAGLSGDPEQERRNWAAAVSRATKRSGSYIPRIASLIDALRRFRTHGDAPPLASEREIQEKLSAVLRSSSDSQVIAAAKALLESLRRDQGSKRPNATELVDGVVARVGIEKARVGIAALTPNLLPLVRVINDTERDARLLSELDSAGHDSDLDARLSQLERRYG